MRTSCTTYALSQTSLKLCLIFILALLVGRAHASVIETPEEWSLINMAEITFLDQIGLVGFLGPTTNSEITGTGMIASDGWRATLSGQYNGYAVNIDYVGVTNFSNLTGSYIASGYLIPINPLTDSAIAPLGGDAIDNAGQFYVAFVNGGIGIGFTLLGGRIGRDYEWNVSSEAKLLRFDGIKPRIDIQWPRIRGTVDGETPLGPYNSRITGGATSEIALINPFDWNQRGEFGFQPPEPYVFPVKIDLGARGKKTAVDTWSIGLSAGPWRYEIPEPPSLALFVLAGLALSASRYMASRI